MLLEKVDLIDGELHQECSLENSWKNREENWPLSFCPIVKKVSIPLIVSGNIDVTIWYAETQKKYV